MLRARCVNIDHFMSVPIECYPTCSTTSVTVAVPGPQGAAATDPLPIANGGTGQATAGAALTAILASAQVPIANGGTGAATKAAAQTALGLGQDLLVTNSTGLSFDIPAIGSIAEITGATLTLTDVGVYAVFAVVTVDYTGVTFASSRTLTLKIRNVSTSTDVISTARNTGVFTTTNHPSLDYVIPLALLTTAAGSEEIQVWAGLSVVESAGSSVVSACSLFAIPLRKS